MENKHCGRRFSPKIAMIVCLLLALAVIAPSASALPAPPTNEITLHIFKHWSDLVRYTLTYDVNGGDTLSTPPQQTAYADTTVRINSGIPTYAGYQFLGWALADNATTADYLPGGEILMDSDKTLYAVWQPEVTPGSVTTGTWTSYGNYLAAVSGNLYEGDFGGTIVEVGVEYSMDSALNSPMTETGTALGSSFDVWALYLANGTWYYRAYVYTDHGYYFYGEIQMALYPG